jgi:GNAT superfamily N-acetyltransferase
VIGVRRAVADDAGELVRLRRVMLAAMNGGEPGPGRWQEIAADAFRRRLADTAGPFTAYVVDKPDRTAELAACAVGVIEHRLSSPENPSGAFGYVLNVATDPGYRRRGYSRACMEAVLDWYRQRGVTRVELRTSAEGEPLYRALGFVTVAAPTLRLSMSHGIADPWP